MENCLQLRINLNKIEIGSQPCFHCILIFPVVMLKSLHFIVHRTYSAGRGGISCFFYILVYITLGFTYAVKS
jgi:hypothetical protein